MKISHIEHLGIAVKSIEEALPYYENVLGLKCYNVETVEDQKVRTAFLKVGEVKIELLEPTCPESTIAKFIEKNNGNGGIHHLAFAIEDGVANALGTAEAAGIRLIDKAPRKGAEGLNIAFLHPKSTLGVLTELCDRILVIGSGRVTGIVDARTATKEQIGLLMTKTEVETDGQDK